MKKFFKILSILGIIICISNTVYAQPESGFRIYTANGDIYTDSNNSRLSAAGGAGTKVYARYNLFNKTILSDHYDWGDVEEFYSCYGSDNSDETLTLGFINDSAYLGKSDIQRLSYQVSKQINYINSIGGMMTGYSFESSGSIFERYALNISWNVGIEHHYARFESEVSSPMFVGYYDLCYSDLGIAQYDIPYMNEN